jgi:sporulation protein YlmC with PRC-barrel domain
MKRLTQASLIATAFGLAFASPLLAAGLPATTVVSPQSSQDSAPPKIEPAEKCLTDLRAFNGQMERDGFPLGQRSYGMYGNPSTVYPVTSSGAYQNARPGYEVRILLASASILARHGLQQPCEDALTETRNIYDPYVANLHGRRPSELRGSGWQQHEIRTAKPVMTGKTSFRSDELLGTDVRTPDNQALGSVDDILMSPQTGKIEYLVLARGGILGIDEKYVPVPWADFKATPNVNLLVLNTTKREMDAAPRISSDEITTPANFDQQSQKIDAFWKANLSQR